MSTTAAPLAGVRVLDLSRFAPGAYCTLLLADLGADVVKAEAPKARRRTARHVRPGLRRRPRRAQPPKRSVALDLRHENAAAVLEPLVGWSQVVVESHRPDQLDRFGLGYQAMTARHPQVVWCSITGFGDVGPNADRPGHDLTYLGVSGLLTRLAVRGHRPRRQRARPELGHLRRPQRLHLRGRPPRHRRRHRAQDVDRAVRRARRPQPRRSPPRNPLRFHSAPGDRASHARSEPPGLLADTDAVLREAGFADDEVAALRESSVIA